MTTKPLTGLTVVAVEQAVAAPLCTARLRDAGARVIKIERESGDFARTYDTAAAGDSSYFAWTNHGKESVVLDFKQPVDAALLERMVARSDVFVQNLTPGALARSGFESAELRERHPRLVTCDISGYGLSGTLANRKAYDLLVQAESGLVGISGAPGEPGRIGVSICDIGTGVTAHAAILEALLARSISGVGRGVSVSLFDVAAEWMSVPFIQHVHGTGGPERVGLCHPSIAPYGAFATRDGSLTLISIQNEREWLRLCRDVLGEERLIDDVRFASNNERVRYREVLESELSALIGQLSRGSFQSRLTTASIAFGTVSTLDDLVAHAALRRRTIVTSNGTSIDIPACPVGSNDSRDVDAIPTLGQHTEAIRAEFAS